MLNKFYTSIPTNYPICGYSDCPMAATCLHQIVYATMLENKPQQVQQERNMQLLSRQQAYHIRTRFHQLPKANIPGTIPELHEQTDR